MQNLEEINQIQSNCCLIHLVGRCGINTDSLLCRCSDLLSNEARFLLTGTKGMTFSRFWLRRDSQRMRIGLTEIWFYTATLNISQKVLNCCEFYSFIESRSQSFPSLSSYLQQIFTWAHRSKGLYTNHGNNYHMSQWAAAFQWQTAVLLRKRASSVLYCFHFIIFSTSQ